MHDGIYHVHFTASTHDSGEGLVVIRENSVNGGDQGYLYRGKLIQNEQGLSGVLSIKRWGHMAQSVFGPLEDFELDLSGKLFGQGAFSARGTVVGQPRQWITIAGRFVGEIV